MTAAINSPDPVAVRQVSAVVTAFLMSDGPDALPDAELRAVYDDVLTNAWQCMPIFLAHIAVLITELAEAEQTTISELWQERASRLAARYPEGDTL